MTIEQIQQNITDKDDLRQIVNQLADYIQANPGAGAASYLVYTATITSLAENNPTINEIENTIGNITITRNGAGDYRSSETFDLTKTVVFIGQTNETYDGGLAYAYIDDASFVLRISTIDSATGLEVDDVLRNTFLEIRVYP